MKKYTLKDGRTVEYLLFQTRLLLPPFYFGLTVALVVYAYKFFQEVGHLWAHMIQSTEEEVLLSVLRLLDITMIANLIVMIIVGSFSTFVSQIDLPNTEKPQWLNHMSSSVLKVKMGSSLVGVSSIHLLQVFINSENLAWDIILKKCLIHLLFLISTVGLYYIAKDKYEPQQDNSEHNAPAHH